MSTVISVPSRPRHCLNHFSFLLYFYYINKTVIIRLLGSLPGSSLISLLALCLVVFVKEQGTLIKRACRSRATMTHLMTSKSADK